MSAYTSNTGLSPVYQGIVGGQSNFGIGQFNFKVNNSVGGGIIKDLTFNSATGTVSSITVNGKSATFSAGKATIYDVNINVPADAGGINVLATVGLVCVGLTNGCPAVSSSTVQVGIAGLTYNNGATVNTDLAPGTTTPIAATSTALGLFNSKPTLTVDGVQKTGLVVNAENKVGEVTIAADANGQIRVNTITFSVVSTNLGSPTYTYRIADGNTTVAYEKALVDHGKILGERAVRKEAVNPAPGGQGSTPPPTPPMNDAELLRSAGTIRNKA
jgi:hypothetical protein